MINNSVCCVIVTYNIGERFYNCFNAIYNQVEQVVIVDNGSNIETLEVLKDIENTTTAKIIYNIENLGIAAALNKGVTFARENNYAWVLTMDNDSVATEYMVDTMLYTYSTLDDYEKKKVVSLFPTCVEMGYASEEEKKIKSEKNNIKYEYVDAEITSGNLVKTGIFKELGDFEEKLFIDMVDYDLSLKILEAGYKHIKISNAILLHSLGNTVKKNLGFRTMTYTNHNYIRRYYMTRNRFYMWDKYKDVSPQIIKLDKSAFIKESVKILLVEKNKIKKFKMIFKGYGDYKKGIFGPLKIN